MKVGKGSLIWLKENPAKLAASADGDRTVVAAVKEMAAAAGVPWRETNYLMLRRGRFVIAAGLDESVAGEPRVLRGRFVNLFDSELTVRTTVELTPGSRWFLLDIDAAKARPPAVLASACGLRTVESE